MRPRLLALLSLVALVALSARPGEAATLGEVLASRSLAPPPDVVPFLGRTVEAMLDDEHGLLLFFAAGGQVHATRLERASQRWTTAPLVWPAAEGGHARPLEADDACWSRPRIERFPGGFVAVTHINPSAACTIVLGPHLAVRGGLFGWPVAMLADGRIVYQRNQVHFAAVHPVALGLFDPRTPAEVDLYPRKPYQAVRAAHIARIRAVYTSAWCQPRNHPCDPEVFDEHMGSPVVADAGADALAFVVSWENTAGWSEGERWRFEAFRELRAALARWDGRGGPPEDLFRSLVAGLARTRNLGREGDVAAALGGDPALRDLLRAALATPPAAGQEHRTWLISLDARWADAETWRRLGRAAEVPEEVTEVVYVYTGLRRPETMTYRELLRRDFEATFGPGAPLRALEPGVLQRLFP